MVAFFLALLLSVLPGSWGVHEHTGGAGVAPYDSIGIGPLQ
jgi:hypothetical protein